MKRLLVAIAGLVVLAGGAYLIAGALNQTRRPNQGVFTNNSYVNGLYENENVIGSREMFRHIFRDLADEMIVYPSECYYYYRTTIRGKHFTGAFALTPDRLEKGVIGFAYKQSSPYKQYSPLLDIRPYARDFGDSDGVAVTVLDDFHIEVEFEGKKVLFQLFQDSAAPPQKAKLLPDETYAGPSFDESGLRFFLVFNKSAKRLYWILNEDGFVAETFHKLAEYLLFGNRTEMVFYNDSVNSRKILVGVRKENVVHNNWFDGPFDQLPDMLIKQKKVRLKEYMEQHCSLAPNKIDDYGNYVGRAFSRVAIVPYFVYAELRSLHNRVDSVRALGLPPSAMYVALTRDFNETPAKSDSSSASAK